MDSVPKVRARSETRYRPAENIETANPARTKSGVNHRVRSADRYLLRNRRHPIKHRRSMHAHMRQSSRAPEPRQTPNHDYAENRRAQKTDEKLLAKLDVEKK